MRCCVKMVDLESRGNDLMLLGSDEMNERIDKLIKLPEEFDWQGMGKDEFLKKYLRKVNKLREISESISKFGNFMKIASSKYTESNNRVINNWEESLIEIKENNLVDKIK